MICLLHNPLYLAAPGAFGMTRVCSQRINNGPPQKSALTCSSITEVLRMRCYTGRRAGLDCSSLDQKYAVLTSFVATCK